MATRRVCPRCRLGVDRKVIVSGKNNIGVRFYCGTTFDEEKERVVKQGVACKRIVELTKKLSLYEAEE